MASLKERLIQVVLRGKDLLSGEAKKSTEALEELRREGDELKDTLDEVGNARGLSVRLADTKRAAEQAATSAQRAQTRATALREELDRNPGSRGLTVSLREAERAATNAGEELTRNEAAAQALATEFQRLGGNTDDLAGEQQRLSREFDEAKAAVKANAAEIQKLTRAQANASREAATHASRVASVREAMNGGARSVLGYAAAYVSLSAAFDLVQRGLNVVRDGIFAVLKTGDQFELLNKRVTSLMGSVAGGEQATAWIKKFAKDTPLEVSDVTEAFALLKSYGLDPMDGTLQKLVDKNEQLGGGMERLTGIASAVGQAYAKQKLETEEILQLIERGVPVWTLLSKVTGKNAAQLQDLATKGKLGRDVIRSLVNEIGKSAEGAAASSMNTLTGLVSNLNDSWAGFLDKVAKSGALDYVRGKLIDLANTIDQMDRDGRLDHLAKSLSDAFVNGASSVETYVKKLGDIDFNALADKAAEMTKKIGPAIDQTVTAAQYTAAALSAVWNTFSAGVNGAASLISTATQATIGKLIKYNGDVAGLFGNKEMQAKAQGFYDFLGDLSDGYAEQAKTDLGQVGEAFDVLSGKVDESAKKQQDADQAKLDSAKAAINSQRVLDQGYADELVRNQQRIVNSAAVGRTAITNMAVAINLISTAKAADQLDGLRNGLVDAYKAGRLSMEDYQEATGLLSGKIKQLGTSVGGTAEKVSDLTDKLGDLKSVQAAIGSARTDVDITNITAALRKLYGDGKITAHDYNEELKNTSDKQKELKEAVDETAKSQADQNQVMKNAITTNEDLRKASGERMEQERRASGEAAEADRKSADDTKANMSAVEGFFGGVLSRARQPLAELSQAALDAFDGISRATESTDLKLDTSSLEATTASLSKVTAAMHSNRAAADNVANSALGQWQAQTIVRSQQLQMQFLEEKQAMQTLTEGYDKGTVSARDFVEQAKQLRNNAKLLNDSDLRTLESSIAAANDKMKQLNESSKSTLESLQDQLDQLQGNQEDQDRRKFASQKQGLQQNLADAQAGGDLNAVQNIMKALSTLSQVEQATDQKRQADDQQKRVDAAKAAQPQPVAASTPAKVIRLETSAGKSVEVGVANDTDETNLLSILESAGLRTI